MCSSHNHTHICVNLQLVIAATKKHMVGTCLAVQWLRICTFITGGTGSITGQGTKIPDFVWCNQKITRNKFYKEVYDVMKAHNRRNLT